MAASIRFTLLLTSFLLLGMVLAGLVMQPRASGDPWKVEEGDFPASSSQEVRAAFLLSYAILAPSPYNTQPWRFSISGDEIRISAERSRWLKVADPDQRQLYMSLGSALENLLLAAEHFGYSYSVSYPAGEDSSVSVRLAPRDRPGRNESLFYAITRRHEGILPCEGGGAQLPSRSWDGVYIRLDSGEAARARLRELVEEADRAQLADPAHRGELGSWIGRGMMGPSGIQALLAQAWTVFLDDGSEALRRDGQLVGSAIQIGLVATEEDGRAADVRAGQALERLWLQATSEGLSVEPMGQVLALPRTRVKATELMPEGHLQQVVLIGCPGGDRTPRMEVGEVMG